MPNNGAAKVAKKIRFSATLFRPVTAAKPASWTFLRLRRLLGEANQRFRIPVRENFITFLGIVLPTDFVLLKEANSVDPAERSYQRLETALTEFHWIGNGRVMAIPRGQEPQD